VRGEILPWHELATTTVEVRAGAQGQPTARMPELKRLPVSGFRFRNPPPPQHAMVITGQTADPGGHRHCAH
jgi:hypothetical protein